MFFHLFIIKGVSMPAKYMGRMGKFDLYAFSENGAYRDSKLAEQLHKIRYRVLETGHPIYCTAVNPDFEKKEEHNPHDSLPTTTHFVSINRKTGEIEYALSTAKDNGGTYKGEMIGIPLENRFMPNGYPPGAPLDEFRSQFLRKNYGIDSNVPSGKIAELYRHVKNPDSELKGKHAVGARLSVYAAAYQYLVRDALQEGRKPTDLWAWDAIPKYANLYAYVNGVFRDLTINGGKGKRWIPTKNYNFELRSLNGETHYFLKEDDTQVTRNLPILFPPKDGTFGKKNKGKRGDVVMIDGLVDVGRAEYMVKKHPFLFPGKTLKERWNERGAMGIVCHRMYTDHHKFNPLVRLINSFLHIKTGTFPWKLGKENRKSHSLLSSELHPLYETDF